MADKIYCYPDTDILINKLDIQNSSQLIEAETRIASIRLYQLQKHPVKGNFDFKHLCNIHNHIFRDLYSWAGELRTTMTVCRRKTILINLYISLLHTMPISMPCTRSERETDVLNGNFAGSCAYSADIC